MKIVASQSEAVGATSRDPSTRVPFQALVSPPASPQAVATDFPNPPDDDWRTDLRQAIRDPELLLHRLGLAHLSVAQASGAAFPTFVPLPFFQRIRPGDPLDPLLLQVWAQPAEDLTTPGFHTDPVGDLSARAAAGVLQKYEGRVLLIVTGNCAVHCRYCFRRHFPYGEERAWPNQWPQTLEYLAADSSLHEVLLSGGDPLTLGDERLIPLLDDLEQIPHLKRIRIHTRLPILIPNRITPALLQRLACGPTTKIMVVHANHAQELDDQVAATLKQLSQVTLLLNQSVLLRQVNDSVEALVALSERLLECRTLPYYLHRLDPVAGAAHFEVPEAEGLRLIEQLRVRLPGYAIPRFVREDPGAPSKTSIA